MTRTETMIKGWKEDGRSFSSIYNDDTDFFNSVGISPECIGITSQTGLDLVYYNTDTYSSDTAALRKQKNK